MSSSNPLAAASPATAATAAPAAAAPTASALVEAIQSADDAVRGPAWQGAGPAGAPAVRPLAGLLTHADFETARSAKRALYQIVRHGGRPGAGREAAAIERELLGALAAERAVPARRELLWMLSEIGEDGAVAPIAALLEDADLREDARGVLLRIPGRKSTAALKKALAKAAPEFQPALADALRSRGEKVAGYPSRKRVPTKATAVKAAV